MYLNTLLHGSHLVVQSRQTWHQLTYPLSGEKIGRRPMWSIMYLLLILLSNNQDSTYLVGRRSWSLLNHFGDRLGSCLAVPTQMGSRFVSILISLSVTLSDLVHDLKFEEPSPMPITTKLQCSLVFGRKFVTLVKVKKTYLHYWKMHNLQ